MGNTATRRAREQRNNTTATLVDGKLSVVAACAAAAQDDEEGTRNRSQSWDNKARKSSIANTTTTPTGKSSNNTESGGVPAGKPSSSSLLSSTRKYVTKNAGGGGGEVSAATVTAQRQRQTSVWSLGSLSGRFNWSFRSAGATKASGSSASFHHRPKTLRKSLSSVQLKRSRTTWPRPVTSTIFSTHFKTASRNDEFSIVHLIAKGAFGAVFKVTDKRRRQQQHHHDSGHNQEESDGEAAAPASQFYALKVLKKSKVIVEHSVGQLKDEADIQKACGHHSFIVRQIDSWQNRHNLHILSEYLPNGELFSKFANFSLDLVRLYLAEIALAIDFLHNAGIIYRDAKPENILLTQSYHLKLTDFGLSKWLKLGAQTKTMCGTLQYMAPEILRGEPYGHAVDWWSMGVIVCEMLIQRCPDISSLLCVDLPEGLASKSVDDVDRAAYTPQPSLKADESSTNRRETQDFLPREIEALPHSAKDVLKRLLEVDPKKRIHSVMALQRIALYMNFKIEAKHLLNISPMDIIVKDGIVMKDQREDAALDELALKAFQDF